jgi:prepilin-type N-terminal cleavage/methylation domain-containing protein
VLEPLMRSSPAARAWRRRGLTLIEVAVAMAVLAILATMTVPSFAERLARQRLIGAAEMLAMDLAEARYQAAQTGLTLHLGFIQGADWCYAVARAPGCDCTRVQACQIKVVRGSDHPGVALVEARDASFDAASLAVEPGLAVLAGLRGSQTLQVGTTPLGRARVCSPSGLKGYAAC